MPEEDQDVAVEDTEKLLVSLDDYLANGVHVGLKYKTADMKPFIYKVRQDKLCVFDIQKIDERLRVAANFIASYNPEDVLVVSNRVYGRKPIKKLAEYTGVGIFDNRFVSGSLTNPNIKTFREPKLLVVTDPTADSQALKEASAMGITIMAVCDSNTRTRNIDLVVPSNNKGKNSLALVYWIITREVLRLRGVEDKFDAELADYISGAEPQPYLLEMQEQQRAKRRKARRGGRRR